MTRIRAMSYNVRYDNRNDHHDAWYVRRDAVVRLVRFHRPDVIGFQEPLPDQRRDLRDGLPDYEFVGRGRRADDAGEGCPIGVRSDRWRVLESDTFWLSKTPGKPSVGWDASHPRIVTWARIERRDESGTTDSPSRLTFMNTHLDHQGDRAREEAARLIRDRLPELRAPESGTGVDPVVFVGDLNATAGSPPHQVLTGAGLDGGQDDESTDTPAGEPLVDAATAADVRHGPTTSITDFADLIDGRRIDHLLVSPDVDVTAFATLADRDDRGRYPSDHLPVLARLDV